MMNLYYRLKLISIVQFPKYRDPRPSLTAPYAKALRFSRPLPPGGKP